MGKNESVVTIFRQRHRLPRRPMDSPTTPHPMKTTYRCQLCGNTITLHINPSEPPTCINPNKHTGKRIPMTTEPNNPTKRRKKSENIRNDLRR